MEKQITIFNSLNHYHGSTIRLLNIISSLKSNGWKVNYLQSDAWMKKLFLSFKAPFTSNMLWVQKLNPFTLLSILIAKIMGQTVICDVDDFDSELQKHFVKKKLFQVCESIGLSLEMNWTTHSFYIQKQLLKGQASIFNQSFDSNEFKPTSIEQKNQFRKDFKLPTDQLLIGHMCSFTSGGMIDFNQVLKVIQHANNRSCHFFLIGGGPDLAAVQTKIEQIGATSQCTFSGFLPREDAAKALKCLDYSLVFMSDVPANRARVSLKVLESLACGIPVVGNLVGESLERFGRFVTPLDYNDLDTFFQKIVSVDETAKIPHNKNETHQFLVKYQNDIVGAEIDHFLGKLIHVRRTNQKS